MCYHYDKKYAPRHRCKQSELRVLMVLDEEENDVPVEIEELRTIEVIEGNILELQKAREESESNKTIGVGLSLSFVVGLTWPKTMKL